MTENQSNMYLYACRYGHSRNTGAPLQIISEVIRAWPEITKGTREQIIRETTEARYCQKDWEALREFAEGYTERRK